MDETTQRQPGVSDSRAADRSRDNLARASLAAAVMLVIQYGLGIGVNLYVALPGGDHGIGLAFSSGPALFVHTVLGLLLIVTAISVLVRAIVARHRTVIVTSAVGLLAIIAAAGYGASFVHSGQAAASMGMAVATGVALLCYIIGLFAAARRQPG